MRKQKPKMRVFINCSPYQQEGVWNLALSHDSHDFYAPEIYFETLDDDLSQLLNDGFIHSYFIKRESDPMPNIIRPSA